MLFCSSPAQAANFAAWRARNFTGTAPCLLNAYQEMPAPDQYMRQARNWQTSIGIQRQLGTGPWRSMRITSTGEGRVEKDTLDNVNLNYRTGDRRQLSGHEPRPCCPIRSTGIISMIPHNTRSGYHGAADLRSPSACGSAGRPRLPIRCRGSRTRRTNRSSGLAIVPFAVAAGPGERVTRWPSDDDQRHRAVLSAIWDVGKGFQVSGLHYFGAGIRSLTQLRR